MKMLARLADRLVLRPTTHPIESETSNQQTIPPNFQEQVWDSLPGVKSRFSIPNAGHGDQVPDSLKEKYLAWIQELGVALAVPAT